uniref:Uncharacterized protein n=1 Tax=Arundo donax TaxID=35708 RepID=A0A0A9FMM4_ARUDO
MTVRPDPEPNKREKNKSQKSALISACVSVKSSPRRGPFLLLTLTAPTAAARKSFACNSAILFCLSEAGSRSISFGFSSSTSLSITSCCSSDDVDALASSLRGDGNSSSCTVSLLSEKKLSRTGITIGTSKRKIRMKVSNTITEWLKSTRSSSNMTPIR